MATILVVDDEPILRDILRVWLVNHGHTVICAAHGRDALDICNQQTDSFHLVITGIYMTGMNGIELGNQLERLHPRLKVIYMSGYPLGGEKLKAGTVFLAKPFSEEVLLSAVEQALQGTRGSAKSQEDGSIEFEMTKDMRDAIIQAYGKVLAPSSTGQPYVIARRKTDLPFPKSVIRQAILQALLDRPGEQYRQSLEAGYVSLEWFVPDEEYIQFEQFGDVANRVAEGKLNARDTADKMRRLINTKEYQPELHQASESKIMERMAERLQELETLRKTVEEAAYEKDK